MTFGEAVRSAREAKGWSLRELAGRAGVSHTYIADIEYERLPSLAVAQAVAEALDKDAAAIAAYGAMLKERIAAAEREYAEWKRANKS